MDCCMPKSSQFWVCKISLIVCIFCTSKNIIRFVKLPYFALTKTHCYVTSYKIHYDVLSMNYELCCSRSKKNVLLKFLGKKKDGVAKGQKKRSVSSVNDLLRKIVRCKSSSDQGPQALQWKRDGVRRSVQSRQDISKLYRQYDKGTKADASYYGELWNSAAAMSSPGDSSDHFVFQQDGAPSHRVKSTLSSSCSVSCRISSNRLYGHPTPTPDLNLVDYAVRGALQQSVYRKSHSSFQPDHLEDRVRTCWESLDQQIINGFIGQWRDRLKRRCSREVENTEVFQIPRYFKIPISITRQLGPSTRVVETGL